ncbi:MAG: aminotransferase class V-fold PLP-dependent enzyme [Granulosicoccus sp.]|nr:aminotransferase class V-fold PLP-dependent enzyme [Granulosicoccus sp.]
MILNQGRDHVSIPGPSVIPERVLSAMHRPAPNIYEGEMVDLVNGLFDDLNHVARSSGDAVMYIGNGHAAWEASLTNTLSRGDTVLALVTGRFTRGWTDQAEFMGITVENLDFGPDKPVDLAVLLDALKADKKQRIKAVLTVHTDTASSVCNDIAGIRGALDEAGHPALLMVDCIASLACERFEMDSWGVDVMVAACQKGLMTPPGLCFTFIGKKAWDFYKDANLKTPYWDWDRRVNGPAFHQKFCGTPPTHHLYGLREALDMIIAEGLESVWRRHKILAHAVWAAVDAWGEKGAIQCQVADPAERSLAVTTIKTADGEAAAIRQWCADEAGVTLGVGLDLNTAIGGQSSSLFRIGHMGHLNPPMLMGTLGAADSAMKALGVEHASGALDAASQVLARMVAVPAD